VADGRSREARLLKASAKCWRRRSTRRRASSRTGAGHRRADYLFGKGEAGDGADAVGGCSEGRSHRSRSTMAPRSSESQIPLGVLLSRSASASMTGGRPAARGGGALLDLDPAKHRGRVDAGNLRPAPRLTTSPERGKGGCLNPLRNFSRACSTVARSIISPIPFVATLNREAAGASSQFATQVRAPEAVPACSLAIRKFRHRPGSYGRQNLKYPERTKRTLPASDDRRGMRGRGSPLGRVTFPFEIRTPDRSGGHKRERNHRERAVATPRPAMPLRSSDAGSVRFVRSGYFQVCRP